MFEFDWVRRLVVASVIGWAFGLAGCGGGGGSSSSPQVDDPDRQFPPPEAFTEVSADSVVENIYSQTGVWGVRANYRAGDVIQFSEDFHHVFRDVAGVSYLRCKNNLVKNNLAQDSLQRLREEFTQVYAFVSADTSCKDSASFTYEQFGSQDYYRFTATCSSVDSYVIEVARSQSSGGASQQFFPQEGSSGSFTLSDRTVTSYCYTKDFLTNNSDVSVDGEYIIQLRGYDGGPSPFSISFFNSKPFEAGQTILYSVLSSDQFIELSDVEPPFPSGDEQVLVLDSLTDLGLSGSFRVNGAAGYINGSFDIQVR